MRVPLLSSLLASVRHSMRTEGALFLYRGCSVPLASLLLKRPVEWAIFERLNATPHYDLGYFGNGAVAATLGAVLGCPFNVVKVKVQSRATGSAGSTVSAAVRETFHARPFGLGFFKGLPLQCSFSVPSASLYLGVYGRVRESLLIQNDGVLGPGAAGSVAGTIASVLMWSVMIPVDTLRTFVQSRKEEISIRDAAKQISKERGIIAFWRGLTPMYVRAFTITAPCMFMYETTRDVVNRYKASHLQREEIDSNSLEGKSFR